MSKILYVDDDPDNLVVFEALCTGRFETLCASSGEEALELLEREEVAVLLADQRMPGMTGVALAERAAAEHPDVVRILVTAYSDLSEAIEAINRGQIRSYLRKPWDKDELLAILKEAESTYATHQRVRELELHMLATERVYTLGVVTAGIAHELKGPLAMLVKGCEQVQSALQRVRDHIGKSEGEEALAVLDSLQPYLEAQLDSTTAMIDTCKGFEPTVAPAQLGECSDLQEVASSASRVALASRHAEGRLRLELAPVRTVRGNRHRLARVLINLLVNAFDAVDEVEDGVVVLRLYEDGPEVVIEVEDNGPGIEPRLHEKIFQVFYSSKPGCGTGLGLAMSRTMVEELGGRLECGPAPERGTIFRVRLP